MRNPTPRPALAEDFLCAEVHLKRRLIDTLTGVNGHVFSESDTPINAAGEPCPKYSPHALVVYVDPDVDRPQELSQGQLAYYQSYEIWLGAKMAPNQCNGEAARRVLGPIASQLLGVAGIRGVVDSTSGVVPGWSPTANHDAFFLVDGPRMRAATSDNIIYLIFQFRAQIAIVGAADADAFC